MVDTSIGNELSSNTQLQKISFGLGKCQALFPALPHPVCGKTGNLARERAKKQAGLQKQTRLFVAMGKFAPRVPNFACLRTKQCSFCHHGVGVLAQCATAWWKFCKWMGRWGCPQSLRQCCGQRCFRQWGFLPKECGCLPLLERCCFRRQGRHPP